MTTMGDISTGMTTTVSCTRDAAKPSPQLVIKKNGQLKATSDRDSVIYKDGNPGKSNNLMDYTCEASGGVIHRSLISPVPGVHLRCRYCKFRPLDIDGVKCFVGL